MHTSVGRLISCRNFAKSPHGWNFRNSIAHSFWYQSMTIVNKALRVQRWMNSKGLDTMMNFHINPIPWCGSEVNDTIVLLRCRAGYIIIWKRKNALALALSFDLELVDLTGVATPPALAGVFDAFCGVFFGDDSGLEQLVAFFAVIFAVGVVGFESF